MLNIQKSDAEKVTLIEEGKKIGINKLLSITKSLITVQNINMYKYKNEIILFKV